MRLAWYLAVTLVAAIAAGCLLIGPEAWTWGLLSWLCTAALACLLYAEQRGHAWTLILPGLLLLVMLALKFLGRT